MSKYKYVVTNSKDQIIASGDSVVSTLKKIPVAELDGAVRIKYIGTSMWREWIIEVIDHSTVELSPQHSSGRPISISLKPSKEAAE